MSPGLCTSGASRRKFRLASVAAVVFLVLFAVGCGKEETGGEGDDCEFDDDCKQGFVCRSGVCTERGGTGDTGVGDGGMTDGGGNQPMEEDYFISFELQNQGAGGGGGPLMVYNTDKAELSQVSPDSIDCFSNCWLSTDMTKFIYSERNGGEFDVHVTDVGSDLKAEKPGDNPMLEGVESVDVLDDRIMYVRKDGANKTGYYTPIDEKNEQQVIPVKDDWFVMPDAGKVVTYEVGSASQSLEVKVAADGNLDEAAEVTLGGPNYQETSGSHYGSSFVSSVSRDGNVIAFVTPSQPNDYTSCSRNMSQQPYSTEDCNDKSFPASYRCGTQERCVRKEVTVNFIDLENADNLGSDCNRPDACGDIHECSIPSENQIDEAKCIPGRTVLGVPESVPQTTDNKLGCEIVAQDDSIDFTGVNQPLSWDENGNLYLVGVRDRSCLGDYEVPASSIVKIDPKGDGYEMMGGLAADEKFDPTRCWDAEEMALDLDNCRVYIDSARVSPEANEIAYSATNPNTSTPGRAKTVRYLWRILRDGTNRQFTGDKDTKDPKSVSNIRVHGGK